MFKSLKPMLLAVFSILLSIPLNAQSISYERVSPTKDQISSNQKKARLIFNRLTGLNIPIDHPKIIEMTLEIDKGDLKSAAKIATEHDAFYNYVVRDFATRMSNRNEDIRDPLSDFVSTIIGIVRDDISAQEMLTGNFTYRIDAAAGLPENRMRVVQDILETNRHYEDADNRRINLRQHLVKFDGQQILSPVAVDDGAVPVSLPDAAGVLTTRKWMYEHATAGTNRRLVEYSMKQFLCSPIETWADNKVSDFMIGRDIDRRPGGSNMKFETTCKSCHTNMDSLRTAFSKVDFEDNRLKQGDVYPRGGSRHLMDQDSSRPGISSKMNKNGDVFPGGFVTTNANWVNQMTIGANAQKFGWRGPTKGQGINEFGAMLSKSRKFSECMMERVFREVCRRNISSQEQVAMKNIVDSFESSNYNLKSLFEDVSISYQCLGDI